MELQLLTQSKMGFDILFWGILLLIFPIYGINDIAAAVLIIVALNRGKSYLSDFKRAIPASWILLAIGILELIFSLIIPYYDTVSNIINIWRYGIIIPLLIFIILGIKELAIIGENKEIHDMAKRLQNPICISACVSAILIAFSQLISWLYYLAITAKFSLAIIIIMLVQVIFQCYKKLNVYPGAVADDED